MNEKHIWSKRPESMLDWFCVVGACIAFYLLLNNLGYFLGRIGIFINILSPFAGGIVIAYILDPMVKFFYAKLFKEKKGTRGFAILLAYAVAILLLMLLGWLVVPQIVNSIGMLFTNFPSYIQGVQEMLLYVQSEYGIDLQQATKMLDDSEAMVKEIYAMATNAMPQIVASIGSVASNFVAIFTSIAASIYMLADKNHLLHQLRTLAHAFLPEKVASNTLRICHYANVNFTGFFVGKIIDSAIIGVITFVAMTILRLDFAVLISVFIGITNIIPVFGPFIGAIPSVFILLLIDPLQAVIFCVLILIIQQVDGNFIGPKILGSSIGISALWILFSIVVGGDLFGIVGMVVGVPVFATLYGLAQEFVHYALDKRGIDSDGNPVEHEAEDTENVFE
ncbi:MAG: AI-2E family transporter [Gemmiger sp.]|uniref:AI-2E family transporter n=1 Tax=Gemmiger sp. TaxID=2049027 RepID=UPI002E763635|nr:AI-2E family transporter [Gemmiger sp.]MEE1423588.1 AI-2E family transporter [Gemmiger sp.]